jgi:VanZ family protein
MLAMYAKPVLRSVRVDWLARCLTWACVVVLALLSLTPGDLMVRTGAPGLAEHFVAYLGTGVIAGLGYRRRVSYTHIAVLLISYAGLLEIGQLWIPRRHFAFVDFAISSAGVAVGVLVLLVEERARDPADTD